MKRSLLSAALVIASTFASSAAVTPQGWWHYGEVADFFADSSGNTRRFQSAFSCVGGGNAGAAIVQFGVGGPLGTTGFTSTNSLYWTPLHCAAAAMWNPWAGGVEWNPPSTNYAIECWILPEETGISTPASRTWFFASGSSDFSQPDRPQRTGAGGVYFAVDQSSGSSKIGAFVIPNAGQGVPAEVQIGDYVDADTNRWMHVAIVNRDGTNTFYVNGVQSGAATSANTVPNGNIFAGGSPGTTPAFRGYLDELRISTFASGQFATADLLLRPPGPNITGQPESTTAWVGGTAPFRVSTAFDNGITYQWRSNGVNVAGATSSLYVQPNLTLGSTGTSNSVVATSSGTSVTSAVATVTVVQNNAANVAVYRDMVQTSPTLVAYFPADNNTGVTLTNTKAATHNGTLELKAFFDGRTNRAFGQRAVSFYGDGDVAIPNNPAHEFPSGNGTIEALVFLDSTALGSLTAGTIFSQAADGGTPSYYYIRASANGNNLLYGNDSTTELSWVVPGGLIGKRTHLALVFNNTTNVTLYANGQNLGTKIQTSFGSGVGSGSWIGSMGPNAAANWLYGSVDELSIYSSALPQNTVQLHYSSYFFGTNTSAPGLLSQSSSRTVYAGGSPVLSASFSGTLPLSFGWYSNGVPVPGANSSTLAFSNITASATYTLGATNAYGSTNTQPIVLTVLAPPAGYATAVMQDAPTAFWRLSEAAGTTAVDVAGYNDATYSGAFTLGATGLILNDPDKAVTLAATSKASAPYSPTLNNPAGPFSIEFWAKASSIGAQCAISSQNRNASRAGLTIFQNNGGTGWSALIGNDAQGTVFVNGATPVQAGVAYHVVVTYDGTDANVYVNGNLDATAPIAFDTGFDPNTVAPFQIGARNTGDGFPFIGVIDDVAVYNYALSQARISNHWSYTFTPANITSEPVGVTTNEWSTVTLSATATGIPNTYQWQKGGADLGLFNNPDGTPHYPNGVNGLNLVISQTHPADSGQYRLVVSNPVGGDTSVNANVVINPDTTKPTIASTTVLPTVGLSGTNPYVVKVTFSEIVDSTSATATGNYSVNGGATVSSVTLGANNLSAYVTTTGLVPGQKYTVNVSGVQDQAQTPNVMLPGAAVAWAPVLSQGLNWDFYPNIPNGVFNLTASPFYPVAPYTNVNFASFSSEPFTGGDLNNKPGFPNPLGETYGCSLSGWITPTVTTNYYFYIASDDASELFLSSDADPVNAVSIAVELDCCDGFLEPGTDSATSVAIPLTAGVRYFIRALQTEGAGGDYVRVAWKMENDPTPSTNLVAISGSVLKSYAPLPAPQFSAPVYNPGNGQLTVSWTGTGTLYQSTNLVNWTAVPGNPPSPYMVVITGTPQRFYRVVRE